MLSAFTFDDGAAFHAPTGTLVLGDLHLGRTYQQDDRAYPVTEYKWLRQRLNALLETHEPDTVVLNGDTFDALPPSDESVAFLAEVFQDVDAVHLTVGNHDDNKRLLEEALPATLQPSMEVAIDDDDILAFHGHRTPTTPASLFIVNHIHPRADGKRCTLYHQNGAYDAAVIVLPTFSALSTGPEYTQYSQTGHSPIIATGASLPSYTVVATANDTPKRSN